MFWAQRSAYTNPVADSLPWLEDGTHPQVHINQAPHAFLCLLSALPA